VTANLPNDVTLGSHVFGNLRRRPHSPARGP
jgi:hypothetical protein